MSCADDGKDFFVRVFSVNADELVRHVFIAFSDENTVKVWITVVHFDEEFFYECFRGYFFDVEREYGGISENAFNKVDE